jgi:hypothetical protein
VPIVISHIMSRGTHMGSLKRAFSSLLLAGGIVLILVGLIAAIGMTTTGVVASIALVAALLYAGGLWFGGGSPVISAPGADIVLVFDRSLAIAAGPAPGTSVMTQFPAPLRPEIEMRCRLALRGEHTHFECEQGGARLAFDIAPIQSIQGVVNYGVLISGGAAAAAATIGGAIPNHSSLIVNP